MAMPVVIPSPPALAAPLNPRLDQLIPAVATKQNRPISEVGDTIRNTFISLVQAHYIERAPPCNLPLPSIRLHPGAVKQKGRGAKAGVLQSR